MISSTANGKNRQSGTKADSLYVLAFGYGLLGMTRQGASVQGLVWFESFRHLWTFPQK